MATMIPGDIQEFVTEGEKAFFNFLKSVAKPDSHYTCWYLPDLSGTEPDFILYSDEVGLVIFEVKDWALRQIREADPRQFTLDLEDKTERRKNPQLQAHEYCYSVKDKSKKMLIWFHPNFTGTQRFPSATVSFSRTSTSWIREKIGQGHWVGKGVFLGRAHPQPISPVIDRGTVF